MRKRAIGLLLTVVVLSSIFLVIRQRYVLNSANLDDEIKKEIPSGSSKQDVLNFVRARHPLYCDDNGQEVKARLSGLAENMVYKKDVVLIFDFDAEAKLRSYSMKVYLTFL